MNATQALLIQRDCCYCMRWSCTRVLHATSALPRLADAVQSSKTMNATCRMQILVIAIGDGSKEVVRSIFDFYARQRNVTFVRWSRHTLQKIKADTELPVHSAHSSPVRLQPMLCSIPPAPVSRSSVFVRRLHSSTPSEPLQLQHRKRQLSP
jgi:hypothetical protein